MQDAPTRLTDLPAYLWYILQNPAFDPRVAFLLYATVGLVLLILLVIGVIALWPGEEEHEEEVEDTQAEPARDGFEQTPAGEVFEGLDLEDGAAGRTGGSSRGPEAPAPLSSRSRVAVASVTLLVLAAVWIVAGYTTSDPGLCRGCHWPAAQHASAAPGTDTHAAVSCVACHEADGVIGRYVTDVPRRVLHFAQAQSAVPFRVEYGRVTRAACSACHHAGLQGIATDKKRGLKISHKEPLDASATCIDCHTLRGGVVGTHNAGMAPCLRCHDAKRASADCVTCHDRDAAMAARARTVSFAAAQIGEVKCGGCHDEKKQCDGCHGMRMPHTTEFKAYAHARAGVVDFWYNGGKTCGRCHHEGRRPCQQCHTKSLGKAHGTGKSWLATGHQKATTEACNTCHGQWSHMPGRDFCADVCHTPAARAGSPR